jgi:hypothetical protein
LGLLLLLVFIFTFVDSAALRAAGFSKSLGQERARFSAAAGTFFV